MKTNLMKIVILSLIFGLVSAKNIGKPGQPKSKNILHFKDENGILPIFIFERNIIYQQNKTKTNNILIDMSASVFKSQECGKIDQN